MTADTPAAAPITAERRNSLLRFALIRLSAASYGRAVEAAQDTEGRFDPGAAEAFLRDAKDAEAVLAALSAPVAAPPADPLLGQALQALVRYANAFDADAKTVAVIQALEARIDAAPPAASGVEWVERAMELAEELETAAILYGASEPESDEERDCRERRLAARDSLRTHLSTALTGAAKDLRLRNTQGNARVRSRLAQWQVDDGRVRCLC